MFLIPVANTAYIRRRPYVTYALIALNAAVWLYAALAPAPRAPIVRYYQYVEELHRQHGLPFEDVQIFELRLSRGLILPKDSGPYRRWQERLRAKEAALLGNESYLVQEYGFVPERGFDYRLLTSLFLHGDFMHLLMNMLFLFLVGCNVEDGWGRWWYTLFYLAAGVVANLAHFASDPRGDLPLVGASGAVSGVMGAFVVFHAFTKIKFFWWFILFGFFEVPAVVAIAGWFLLQVLNAFFFRLDSVVAYGAHIGGFLFDLAIAVPVRLVKGAPPKPRRAVPSREEQQVALPGARLFTQDWAYEDALKRAEAYLDEGDPAAALPLFQEVLERDAKHIGARWGLVRCYRALGMRREALLLGEELIADLAAAGQADDARRVYSFLMS